MKKSSVPLVTHVLVISVLWLFFDHASRLFNATARTTEMEACTTLSVQRLNHRSPEGKR
jgi:hypothetical protein